MPSDGLKNFLKPLDKATVMWYNIGKERGEKKMEHLYFYDIPYEKMVGVPLTDVTVMFNENSVDIEFHVEKGTPEYDNAIWFRDNL